MRDKIGCVVGRIEKRMQISKGLIVETEVGAEESFFQNGGAGLQHHGGAFHLVGRGEKNFTVSFEESTGDFSCYIGGKTDDTIVEGDMEGSAVDLGVADVEDSRGIQAGISQLKEEILSGFWRPGRSGLHGVGLGEDESCQ